jgi:predicted kinase
MTEETDNTLIVMVGLPRSGKSTWAKARNLPIVSPDAIRLALHGMRFLAIAEPMVWVLARIFVRALFLAGNSRVIVDGCHIKRDYRDEWQSDNVLTSWRVVFKHVQTSQLVCLNRARALNDSEIIPIIERDHARFEPLGNDEEQLGAGV